MSLKTLNLFQKVNRTKCKYNILTFNTHERYQTSLAKTGHDFYAFNYKNSKSWFNEHAPVPKNYYQLPIDSIFSGIVFDFILVQSKFGQFQVAQQLNRSLQLPVICLEHTLPVPNWTDDHLRYMRSMQGDINVFITNYSKKQWEIQGEVVYHGIDTKLFKPADCDRSGVLTVAHDFINRDYALNYNGWNRITKDLNRKVIGNTPGLSKPSESVENLIEQYQRSSVYINPSVLSPIPTSLLEAMACGCAIVSTDTCDIPKVIKHGVNGYLSNDENELRSYVEKLLNDQDLARKMGNAARETIEQDFNEQKFIDNWNHIFNKAYGVSK